MTDSSTGGWLQPNTNPSQLDDDALTDFLQELVVGITGLPGELVRPRWQPVPPNSPDINTNWAAVGIMTRPADSYAFEGHFPDAGSSDGLDLVQMTEEIELMCSFYGPSASGNCAILRQGLAVAQNREQLQLAGMGLINCGPVRVAPVQLNTKWYNRVDMSFFVRRAIARTYNVLNLNSADGTIVTDTNPVISVPVEVTES